VGDRRLLADDPPAAWLIKPGDEHSLANGLQKLFSDSTFQQQLKLAGLEKVKQYFWQTIAVRAETIFINSLADDYSK
jgi:glycosyltransferase involved in cell wall biosynthesis